jgi:hypothetical protein
MHTSIVEITPKTRPATSIVNVNYNRYTIIGPEFSGQGECRLFISVVAKPNIFETNARLKLKVVGSNKIRPFQHA